MNHSSEINLNLNVLTLNVKGLRDYRKRRKIFNYIKKHILPEGIFFLQETHSLKQDEGLWSAQFRGGQNFSHGTNDSRGVLTGFTENLDFAIESEHKEKEGRYLLLKCIIQGHSLLLINLYNANQETNQVKVISDLLETLGKIDIEPDSKIIFGEDIIVISDILLESDDGNPSLKTTTLSRLEFLLQSYELCDIWRIRNKNTKRYTYRQRTLFIQRRPDYIFVSSDLQDCANATDVIPSVNNDHSAVYLQIRVLNKNRRGRSYWKFNNSLLSCNVYTEKMNREIE